jgi:hypothetical protein
MNNLFAFGLLSIIKFFLLTLLFLFVVFSAIVVRQVQLMNRVLTVPIAGSLRIVALALLLFAIGIFLVARVTL